MIRLALIVLTCVALLGCADAQKKKRPSDGTYEQLSPFNTQSDPFEL